MIDKNTSVSFMGQKYGYKVLCAMIIIKAFTDINHLNNGYRYSCLHMIFSKTFVYALRGVLYLSVINNDRPRVQLDEIARQLSMPRHFLGKVMNKLANEGVLNSMKGPFGGFSVNDRTREMTLFELMEITGEVEKFSTCVLRLRECSNVNPCPVHSQIDVMRKGWQLFLSKTTIASLLKKEHPDFIKSITAI